MNQPSSLVITFGCQMNLSDSQKIEQLLLDLNFLPAKNKETADLVVINTCGVRQAPENRLLSLVHQLRKQSATKTLVITGCLAHRLDLQKKLSKHHPLFVNILDLPQFLQKKFAKYKKSSSQNMSQKKKTITCFFDLPSHNSSSTAYVPIMTGCNNFCSYCVVPYSRGKEISRPPQKIIAEVKKLVEADKKEIILLGQNVNSYCPKTKGSIKNFPDLLKTLDQISGDYWLRFFTSHPKDMSQQLITAVAKGVHLAPYIHLPFQAGSNRILKAMNRHYTSQGYLALIKKIRQKMPLVGLTTDIIVGFPNETNKDFLASTQIMKKASFDMAYIACYSPRPQTAAFKLNDNVPLKEKKRRRLILNKILERSIAQNNQFYLNKIFKVLIDYHNPTKNFYLGKTRTFKQVKIFSKTPLKIGEFYPILIKESNNFGLIGSLVKPPLVTILGPTACGKTHLAVKLAYQFNGLIISADSRQVYKKMDLGTGKDLAEYQVKDKKIPYALIDIVEPWQDFSLGQYQKLAQKTIKEAFAQNRLPFLVGGSALYLKAITEGLVLPPSKKNSKLRQRLTKMDSKKRLALLKKTDPVTFQKIDQKNHRRIIRALELIKEHGKPLAEINQKAQPQFENLILGITFPINIIRKRIKKRLEERIKAGLITEVKKLRKLPQLTDKKLDSFGLEYRFVLKNLKGELSYQELLEKLSIAIGQFAKKQMTWFKKDPHIIWLKNLSQAQKEIKAFQKKYADWLKT